MIDAPIRPTPLFLVPAVVVALTGAPAPGPDPAPQASPVRPVPAQSSPAAMPPAVPPAEASTSAARSPRNASYSIDVTLDPDRRTLTGREVITWRNTSPSPAGELRLHLYWNAWKHTRSAWLRDRALARTGRELLQRPAEDWGYTRITAIRLVGLGAAPPVGLSGGLRFVGAEEGAPGDETLAAVPLPVPVAPGQTINLDVEWAARIPRTFARTGAIDRWFFIAQWFPKAAVLEADGWGGHPFRGPTEFFADYGVYDVRIRVPAGWVVGATGRERSRRDNGDGTTTHRYVQEDVHDFAWMTSPHVVERFARFDHPTLPSVSLRLLLMPEHVGQADRHVAAATAALRAFGEWFGPYPYGHLTIVDPAWQSDTGGMEYPTLITAGTRWLAPRAAAQPERVTIHETGHQFWYGLVANNEFEHAWLDEGLTTWATARLYTRVFPPGSHVVRAFGGLVPWPVSAAPLDRVVNHEGLARYRASARADVPATPTYRYWPASAASITYYKTALWLHTLENHLGGETLQRALSTYFKRWRFRHPRPADLFATVNEVSGRDLSWFFDQVHRDIRVFDYGVERLDSTPVRPRGYVEKAGRLVFDEGPRRPDRYETTVLVRRYGDGVFPVDVVVTFEDGETVRERWDGRDPWRAFTFVRAHRARRAEVDPEGVLALDVNRTNNGRTLAPASGAAARRWASSWMVWLEDLLLTAAFFV